LPKINSVTELNLPAFDYKLKKAEGKVWIFDIIRKKFVVLLPEEWVRQHVIHYLINHLGYPKSLIRIEGGLRYNQRVKRADVVVYDRAGAPWMLVECKAPSEPVSDQTLHQASIYNMSLKARYIVLTNGLVQYVAVTDELQKKASLLQAMPSFGE